MRASLRDAYAVREWGPDRSRRDVQQQWLTNVLDQNVVNATPSHRAEVCFTCPHSRRPDNGER